MECGGSLRALTRAQAEYAVDGEEVDEARVSRLRATEQGYVQRRDEAAQQHAAAVRAVAAVREALERTV